MPRNVRNFWVELEVDGRKQRAMATGPRNADGGFSLRIYQRDNGQVAGPFVTIYGDVDNGKLVLRGLLPVEKVRMDALTGTFSYITKR